MLAPVQEKAGRRHDVPPGPDGGAGNRTLVRVRLQNRVYVRRLDFRLVSSGRHRTGLPNDHPRWLSLEMVRDHLAPARLCDSTAAPRTGSDAEGALASRAQLTQPVPVGYWQLERSRRFFQGSGPGHATIPSSNPSKPVAPGLREYNREPDRPITARRSRSSPLPRPPPPGSSRSSLRRKVPRLPAPPGSPRSGWSRGTPTPRTTR